MKTKGKKGIITGCVLLAAFIIWTALVMLIDAKPLGQNGTNIGFSSLNIAFHDLTGVSMTIYNITDVLGVIPLIVCLCFFFVGLIQLIKRKSIKKVDSDLILLGVYYIIVLSVYAFFEVVPVNYRPVLIEGVMESSYPSSTTLLVLSVMPTLSFQVSRRAKGNGIKIITSAFVILFSVLMVAGRTVSGVHWLTDIIGSVIISSGLLTLYFSSVLLTDEKKKD